MAATTTTRGVTRPSVGTWTLDEGHTTISFVARHLMVTKVRGRFNSFKGTATIGENASTSGVEVTIDAGSIDTGVEFRDNHLRGEDFLSADAYPTIRFASTGVRQTGEDTLEIEGELTIRDVTRPVTLDVRFEGVGINYDGSERAGFSASVEIDREEWGITWNQAVESGGVLVSRRIKLELDVQLVKDAA